MARGASRRYVGTNGGRLVAALATLSLLTAAGLAGCDREGHGNQATADSRSTATVRIGYLPITHALSMAAADQVLRAGSSGLRLELVRFSSWPELTDALDAGKIDGASTMIELALVAKQQGFPLKLVALTHQEGNTLVARKGINSIVELKGMTVAIPHRMSVHNILLHLALARAGLRDEDVKKVEMAPPDMMAALARGEIDAYIVAEPFGAAAIVHGVGAPLLRDKDIWPESPCCGLVLREEFIRANPTAVQELVTSVVQGGRLLQRDRTQAEQIAQQYFGYKRDLMEQSLPWVEYGQLTPRAEEVGKLQQYLVDLGLVKNPVKIADFMDAQYAKKAYSSLK